MNNSLSAQIKEHALSLEFDAVGICAATAVNTEARAALDAWLANGYNADMAYMARNTDKRTDPRLLVEGAHSVVCVALNYYPHEKQDPAHPQFAYYAYGKDYHDVMRDKLSRLLDYIKTLSPDAEGRYFTDTAPVLERYWAVQAGLGFIGKNSLLIMPRKGSYFFLGELILNIELDYDTPLDLSCGRCTRCMDACPTQAIVAERVVDARRCISYQTIENKGEIDGNVAERIGDKVYGCDVCQQVCPWNKYARPHSTPEFDPSQAFLDLSYERMEELTEEEYRLIFKGSAVKRAKYGGLMRNLKALKKGSEK